MVSPYDAAPLDLARNEIRLMQLKPAHESNTIECTLRSYSLDDRCLTYVALSYRWGSKKQREKIVLNGTSRRIGRNLGYFLQRMQKHKELSNSLLWIDALCINQSDVRERNHQVQMMRRIYSDAQTVWIWLGREDMDSSLAMEFLKLRKNVEFRGDNFNELWQWDQVHAVLRLCKRKYWTRIWIVQEIMLARDAMVMCGDQSIAWSRLQEFIDGLKTMLDHTSSYARASSTITGVVGSPGGVLIRARSTRSGPQSLATLISVYRHQEATDIRDKIYGLCGLASDGHALEVDYNIDARTLLLRLLYLRAPSETQCTDNAQLCHKMHKFVKTVNGCLNVGLLDEDPADLVDKYIACLWYNGCDDAICRLAGAATCLYHGPRYSAGPRRYAGVEGEIKGVGTWNDADTYFQGPIDSETDATFPNYYLLLRNFQQTNHAPSAASAAYYESGNEWHEQNWMANRSAFRSCLDS